MLTDFMSEKAIKKEHEWICQGKASGPNHEKMAKASESAEGIVSFTKATPDPFSPTYQFTNPWCNKKENKGKKDPPPKSAAAAAREVKL